LRKTIGLSVGIERGKLDDALVKKKTADYSRHDNSATWTKKEMSRMLGVVVASCARLWFYGITGGLTI